MPRTLLIGCGAVLAVVIGLAPAPTHGAALILNECNSIAPDEFPDPDDAGDSFFGYVEGNGDNWLELVVVEDHQDIRGWQLRWFEDDGDGNADPSDPAVWDGSRMADNQSQGVITFGPASLWADLRAGTIITISEKQIVETEEADGTPATFDLSTDASYDPVGGDWNIHVSSLEESGKVNPLVDTLTNVDGDDPGSFSVGHKDWELQIYDGTRVVFGPIGEGASGWGGGSVKKDEVVRLEADPGPSVDNGNYDDADDSTFGAPNVWGTDTQDFSPLRAAAVPEPDTLLLLVSGALALLLLVGRFRPV